MSTFRQNSSSTKATRSREDFFSSQDRYIHGDILSSDEDEVQSLNSPQARIPHTNPITKRTRSRSDKLSSSKRQKKSGDEKSEMKLFSGLKFFASKLHNSRASKFKEYGAVISKSYNPESITHLLVQQRWTGRKVAEYLKVEKVPPDIKVVYNSWASESIEQDKLLDISQYEVPQVPRLGGVFRLPPSESPPSKADRSPRSSRSPSPISDSAILKSDHYKKKDTSKSGEELLLEIMEGAKNGKEYSSSDEDEIEDTTGSASGAKRRHVNTANFLCVSGKSGMGASHPNKLVLDLFSEQLAYYEAIRDNWKTKAYRTAINSLRKAQKPIRTAKEAKKLPGFGGSLADHLEEIVKTGKFSKLHYQQENDEQAKVISLLLKIYGVGPVTASKWYKEGVKTLEDVRNRTDLTEQQLVGLDHYEDFNLRIPRAEVTKHYEVVKHELAIIDPEMDIYCMGSYRRGMPDCGDIDLIITKKNIEMEELCHTLYNLLERLGENGFIKTTLAGKNGNDTRWMGATALDSTSRWRRMDILLVPWKILGSSLIYYTGDDIYNRSIRQLAKIKGYRLSNNGLFLEKTGGDGKKNYDTLIESSSEKKIFEILDVPYRAPTDRNIGHI